MQSNFPTSPFHSIGKGQIQVAQFYVQFSHQLAQFCMQIHTGAPCRDPINPRLRRR